MTPWQSESCVESVFAMQLRINSGRRADRPSKQANERAGERATFERPEDARTHASHASSGSKDTRMPTLQPLPTLLLPLLPISLLLSLPLLLLLSSKSIILSATNAALFLPSAYGCQARLAQICTPKTPETTSAWERCSILLPCCSLSPHICPIPSTLLSPLLPPSVCCLLLAHCEPLSASFMVISSAAFPPPPLPSLPEDLCCLPGNN